MNVQFHSITLTCLMMASIGCNSSFESSSEPPIAKMDRYLYQCFDGGPHIVLANTVATNWAGHEMAEDVLDPSTDYGRACQIRSQFGFISVGGVDALVFSNPPLAAWDPSSTADEHYFFVLLGWNSGDTDALIDRAKANAILTSTEQYWNVPEGGARMIFAGDDPDGSIVGRINIPSLAGRYNLSTGVYNVAADGHVLVLRFRTDEFPLTKSK